jgi:hypothetical protein
VDAVMLTGANSKRGDEGRGARGEEEHVVLVLDDDTQQQKEMALLSWWLSGMACLEKTSLL